MKTFSEMKDRRENPRVAVSFPVECNALPRQDYFYTVSKDLSLGGAKILTDNYTIPGSFFKVNINLINRVINLKAKVAWCNKERMADRYSLGLQFVEMNVTKNKVLSSFLSTALHT